MLRPVTDPVTGHQQAGRRPILVVSKEAFNQATGLLTIVPLTSLKAGRKLYPNEVLLPAAIAGPPADSIALCHQIRTISGARAYSMVGRLTDGGLRQRIAEALLDHLELVDLDLLTEEP
ncbi:MAG: type II toxin-antitoxin system PemK/MazF family toxin [Chloroflexota bacterium]